MTRGGKKINFPSKEKEKVPLRERVETPEKTARLPFIERSGDGEKKRNLARETILARATNSLSEGQRENCERMRQKKKSSSSSEGNVTKTRSSSGEKRNLGKSGSKRSSKRRDKNHRTAIEGLLAQLVERRKRAQSKKKG